jgi:putative membrane protein
LTAIANYAIYLLLAGVLLLIFFMVYTWVTPFNEILLIRQGNCAAALSLGGAMIGFSLTVASCIFHTSHYQQFMAWAAGALVVQVLVYAITAKLLRISKQHIESGNTAFGALLCSISLSVGAINAACIS